MEYVVEKEVLSDMEIGIYTTYGIAICDNGRRILEIHDVCRSGKEIKKFCSLCNRLKLDPIHIYDAIEDNL